MKEQFDLRDVWLNHPSTDSISEKELSTQVGQYIVEAMQLIESDNLRRKAILNSAKSTPEEKQEALSAGIWYPHDYFAYIKNTNFKTRIEYFQKRGDFLHGMMNPKLWEQTANDQTPTGKLQIYKWKKTQDTSPAEELVNLLGGKAFCLLECATVMNIAHYAALLRVWGKARFDRCFTGNAPLTLSWVISHYATINPMYLFIEGVINENESSLQIGDKIGIKGHPAYNLKHPYGAASQWNLICCDTGIEKKFIGFGLGSQGKTTEQISTELIGEYNKNSCFDDNMISGDKVAIVVKYYQTRVAQFEHSSFPRVLTQEEFKKGGGGLSNEIIRLDSRKIKLILLEREDSCNLYEVFKITKAQALKYAMDEKTLKIWQHHKTQRLPIQQQSNLAKPTASGLK